MDEESIRSVREMVMENSILQQREMQAEILYQKEMEAVTKDPEYSTAVDYDGEPIDAGPPGDEVIGDDAYEQESLASMREVIDDSQFNERGFNSGVDDAGISQKRAVVGRNDYEDDEEEKTTENGDYKKLRQVQEIRYAKNKAEPRLRKDIPVGSEELLNTIKSIYGNHCMTEDHLFDALCLFAGKVGISPKEKLFTEKGTVQQILWGLRLISARQNLGVEQETPRVRKLRNDFLLAEMLYEDLNSNLMKLLFEVKQFNQATNPLTDDQIKLRGELTRNIPTAKESLRRTEERMFKIGIQIQPPHEFLHFDSFERTSKYKPVRAQIALKIAEDEVLNWNMYQCTLNPEVYAAFEASLHIINEVYETEMVGENSFYSEGKYNIDEILQRRQNPLRMMMIDIAAICYRQNRIESGRGAVRTDKAARGIVMDLAIQRKILVRYFHSS